MIEEILEKYTINTAHAKQVKTYALMIFDALNNKLADFSENEKKYLSYAALLHDVGYFVEAKSHHKHSLDMILKMQLEDINQEEVKTIAHLARYHRSSLPDEDKHRRYSALTPEQKNIIQRLAPILRLADGLDSPHKNLVTGVEFEETPDHFNLFLRTVGFPLKLKCAEAKKEFFEIVYKKPLNLICKRI